MKKINLLKIIGPISVISAVIVIPIVSTVISNSTLNYYWGFNKDAKDLEKNVVSVKQNLVGKKAFYDSRSYTALEIDTRFAIELYFSTNFDEFTTWLDKGKMINISIIENEYNEDIYYRLSYGGQYARFSDKEVFLKNLEKIKGADLKPKTEPEPEPEIVKV